MSLLTFHRRSPWLMFSLMTAASAIALASQAHAQTAPRPSSTPPSDSSIKRKNDSDPVFGSPTNEMRSKLILKEEKKRYDENQARAREIADLAAQLCNSYESRKAFNSEDAKKLERLEKLTKRVRNEAGGSDTRSETDVKDLAATTQETLKSLAEIADELQKLVEKTPRFVVSAAVIEQANRLIGITQHLRGSN